MKKALILIFPVLLCLGTGFVASRLQADALALWYPTLRLSPLTPPNWVFPVAWTILYICMGLSIGLVHAGAHPGKYALSAVFALQLALNFSWSIAFFYYTSPLAGLVIIILLLLAIIWYASWSYPFSTASFLLFLPYGAWVSFALYLNLYIVLHN